MLRDILKTLKFGAISSTALVFFLSGSEVHGQSGSDTFVSFDQFLSSTAAAVYNSATMPKVTNAAAFEEMRQHILKINESMQVTHSFVSGSQTYDCIAIESQPAIRLLGLKGVATPPAPKATPSGATGAHTSVLPASGVDRFGNAIGCQDKTVPIGRTTLEQMTRFPTLQAFLRRRPAGKGKSVAAKDTSSKDVAFYDAYIFTNQTVYSLGITSTLSINQPAIPLPIEGNFDSFSSVQAMAFDGTEVDAGWSIDPGLSGDNQVRLYSWYVGDDNHDGNYCYNYDCGAFVQYDGSLFLGVPLSPVSVPGGAQGEVTIQWEWSGGNWWLQVNGTWVGYYPGGVFVGDMATHADIVQVSAQADGKGYLPQVGSGYWGTYGYPYAAYQRQIWYYDGAYNAYWATGLSYPPNNNCPASTSTYGPYFDTVGDWGVYFYFGGPGGSC
jgi:hypothetical protein